MFGLCLDEQLGSGEPVRRKATDKLIGKPHGNEGQGVCPVGRRVEHAANREVRWRVPESERSLVEAPGKAVGKTSFGTKSGQYRALVQHGELTQRADPEPPEHVGEHGQSENLQPEATEPLRRRAMGHDHAFASGEPCSKWAVGDPHPARRLRGCSAGRTGYGHDGRGCGLTDLFGKGDLSAEVTGRGPDR